ncbi:MAG: Sua5/YciO/YrdC/YwlC family protein [Enterobacteriaceae bacterium]
MQDNTSLSVMVRLLQQGEVIAYPTEAVYGLGCDPDNQQAVMHLLQLKRRPVSKGLILVAASYSQLQPYIDETVLTEERRQQMLATWPGHTTWLIPVSRATGAWLTGAFSTLAVRVSAHPAVQQLCQAYGKPVVSTSANLAGQSPCRTEQEVRQQFGAQFPLLSGEVGGYQNPSPILDAMTGKTIRTG